MSHSQLIPAWPVLRSLALLALMAPVVVGGIVGLSAEGESAGGRIARHEGGGSLRSTRVSAIDLAALPQSAFGDAE